MVPRGLIARENMSDTSSDDSALSRASSNTTDDEE